MSKYYYLKDGDTIQKDDEFQEEFTSKWLPVKSIGAVYSSDAYLPMRRRPEPNTKKGTK